MEDEKEKERKQNEREKRTFTCVVHLPKMKHFKFGVRVFILRAFIQSLMALFWSPTSSIRILSETEMSVCIFVRGQCRKQNATILQKYEIIAAIM